LLLILTIYDFLNSFALEARRTRACSLLHSFMKEF